MHDVQHMPKALAGVLVCCVVGCGKGGSRGADRLSEVCIIVLCICARCSVAGTDGVLGLAV